MIGTRPATLEDAKAIVSFQLRMARETEELELDAPTVEQGVAAVFADPSKGTYWVADDGGRPVGSLLVVPEWSDWRNATVWWVHSVYVEPEYRRQGVFRRMYQHLRRQVEARQDLAGLRLYVEKSNAAAQGVYRAMGMDGDHYLMYEWMKG